MILVIRRCQFIICCILLIVPILTVTSAQECPTLSTNTAGACFEGCSSDNDCSDGQMCCSNGCGHECMSPVPDPCATMPCPLPPCDESSPGTMTPEGQCCPVCACTATDGSMVAAGTSFKDDCNTCSCSSTGVALCTLIACTSNVTSTPTSTTPPAGQTCPKVQNTSEENCTDECSSDDDCQYDRICCSNGCGGHVCSDSVERCAVVFCASPICDDDQGETSPFRCCPSCPSPFKTCPAIESTTEENINCVDECSSDDDCQNDKICCSNGCGGHVCSDSVEMCQLVRCEFPSCEGGVEPETSPFECCPFCPITDNLAGGDKGAAIASVLAMIMCGLIISLLL